MAFTSISGQVAQLIIANVGTFGVTKVEAKRSYVNADTTVTQNSWEQFCPIVRGVMLDVTVPMSTTISTWIDDAFDGAEFNTPGTINGLSCTLNSNPSAGEVYIGTGLIDSYSIVYDAKDAARVIFTIRFTGEVL